MGKAKVIEKNYDLAEIKVKKKQELSDICSDVITSGFQSKIVLDSDKMAHYYGTDIYDQQNFTQKMILILNSRGIVNIPWKCIDVPNRAVIHTREEFIAVVEELGAFIEGYRMKNVGLKMMVDGSQDFDTVQAITFN